LTGTGGTGKTRLAVQVASASMQDFVDGVYFVDLSTLKDAAAVPSAIVTALSLREDPGRELLDWLIGYLRDREMLLVLDNLEQVAGAPALVGRLLDGTTRLRILATSRVPLHLSGEQEYPVAPLALPRTGDSPDPAELSENAAVALFVARAQTVQPGFVLTAENAAAIAELTVRLDGLPLAIELAASRVKVMPPATLASRLGDRLPLLTGGAGDLPDRQRTLRAAIDWSCDLLVPAERRLFARLGVFAGGWALESAEAVCSEGLEMPVLDVLGGLLDKSLIQQDAPESNEPRFRMLETIREYALGLLSRSREEDPVRALHAQHFMELAERAEPHLRSADQRTWFARFAREAENVRSVFEWCTTSGDAVTGARLATAIWRYWAYQGRLRDGRTWLEQFVASPRLAEHDLLRFRALTALGGLDYWQNDFAAMRPVYEEALEIAKGLGDPAILGQALYDASYISAIDHDDRLTEAMNREALAHAEQAADRSLAAEIKSNLAFLSFFSGKRTEGFALLSEAIAVARQSGDAMRLSGLLLGLGSLSHLDGDGAAAHRHLAEALTNARDAGSRGLQGESLLAMSLLATRESRFERAARLIGAAARFREGYETRSPAQLVGRLGDPEGDARRALGEARFADEWSEGYAMTLDEAITYALEGAGEAAPD
jgi:predicted ATPase